MWMNKAYEYCKKSIRLKTTPKYVKLQMKEFINICEGKHKKYIINNKKVKQVENILKLLVMPKGLKAGQTLYECTTGYQWLFIIAILCTVYKDNPNKRRYETGVLEICRKNFKTYTIATIFIILFLTEPKFSKFYSVAPDGALSREIRDAISETIRSSPLIYTHKEEKRFKLLRDYIFFKPTSTQYVPLSYSTSRMDGRLPNAFIYDETGALPNGYPIQAMRSGQLNILNKWKNNNIITSLSAPVGINEQGELFKIDLHEKAHGPHGLIAGMTGSGKSEFIISFILSMAVNYHPNEVQFVLIDYKGGGLSGAFENSR